MAEAILALYLGNEVLAGAVSAGLDFLVNMKLRVDYAFMHAKTRTMRLSEAAQFASDFLSLFEGTVDELQANVFGGQRAKALTAPRDKLARAVKKAHALMQDLEGKSRMRWLAFGDGYREDITKATKDLDEAGQQLSNVLSSAASEVGLAILSKVTDLQQQRKVAEAEAKEPEVPIAEMITETELNANELKELAFIVAEKHSEFTRQMSDMVQRTNVNANATVTALRDANGRYEASLLLTTRMGITLKIHSDARELANELGSEGAWKQLKDAIRKAFDMIDVVRNDNVPGRREQIPKSRGLVRKPLDDFRRALRACDQACHLLAADQLQFAAGVRNTLNELHDLDEKFGAALEAILQQYASNPTGTNKDDAVQYFSAKLNDLVRELAGLLMLERRQMLIAAHKFLYKTNFALAPPSPLHHLAGEEGDEPDSGKTEIEDEDALQYPEIAPQADTHISELLTSAKNRIDRFFEREGNRLSFSDKPIKHLDMLEILNDLEILGVYTRSGQKQATAELEKQVVDSIQGLAEVFINLPPSVTTPPSNETDLSGMLGQLGDLDKAMKEMNINSEQHTTDRQSLPGVIVD